VEISLRAARLASLPFSLGRLLAPASMMKSAIIIMAPPPHHPTLITINRKSLLRRPLSKSLARSLRPGPRLHSEAFDSLWRFINSRTFT
jgi:hypothetical protein